MVVGQLESLKLDDGDTASNSAPPSNMPMSELESCSAALMWRAACSTLSLPGSDVAWKKIEQNSPADTVWHSLRNCVAYQTGIWQKLLAKGVEEVTQPAAFKLALVLRHSPSELSMTLLADLLSNHPQSLDLTSYVLALLTDDDPIGCGNCGARQPPNLNPAPLRDLLLFGDCELAILAASKEEYDAHAKLVRAEYAALTHDHYVELRIKVLDQLSHIPKLFHTPEFECFESAARENVEREITTLRDHLGEKND